MRAYAPRLPIFFDMTENEPNEHDHVAHDWYSFVLQFPPHLVRQYVRKFSVDPSTCVLDPFCGTGTTLVECKKLGIPSCGIEATPLSHFASNVKLDWDLSPQQLVSTAEEIAAASLDQLTQDGLTDTPSLLNLSFPPTELRELSHEAAKLLIKDSISPLPLHKALVLAENIKRSVYERPRLHHLLALARILPTEAGNLRFGPEVGVGKPKLDAPVVSTWLRQVKAMARDLSLLWQSAGVPAIAHLGDARDPMAVLKPGSVDAVFTSPPYPNEKDYTRIIRLESVLLGFFTDRKQLRDLKQSLLRSNTRNVYKVDDDDQWVAHHPKIQQLAESIEARRVELGKTSGFERLYSRVTVLYFGGMARHLSALRHALRPGAQLGYVVGDQASYFQVMIETGNILAEIAQHLGYELEGIDLFRTRIATATGAQLREEVVLLRWPGFPTPQFCRT